MSDSTTLRTILRLAPSAELKRSEKWASMIFGVFSIASSINHDDVLTKDH